MDSAADRKSIRRREKQARIDAASSAAVIRNVMSTVEGRAWLWSFLSDCHIFSTSFTGDALTSAFAEGERNVGQRLLNTITSTCPDEYIQAMRESHVRSAIDERRSGPVDDGRDSGPVDSDDPDGADLDRTEDDRAHGYYDSIRYP